MPRRDASYAAGVATPRPSLSGSRCGHAPLHLRVHHPRMRVYHPQDDGTPPLHDPAAPPLTLRALRNSIPIAKPFADDADLLKGHAFDLALSGLDIDAEERSLGVVQALRCAPCDGLVLPTAEDVADDACEHRLSTTSKSGRVFIGPPMKRVELHDVGGGASASPCKDGTKGAQVSEPPLCGRNTTKHFRERVYHKQLFPDASEIIDARATMVQPSAVSPRPFLTSAPPRIPPYERCDAEHCALMDALAYDHVGRSRQAQHEAALERSARARVRHELEQRQSAGRRARLATGQGHVPTMPVGPSSSASRTRTPSFPLTTRLHQLGHRLGDGAVHAAPRSTVDAFLRPTFVIPASRRYGSKKYTDAPRRRMAYEAPTEDEEDTSALLAKFEKTSRCPL